MTPALQQPGMGFDPSSFTSRFGIQDLQPPMPQAPSGMMFRGFGSMSAQGTPYAAPSTPGSAMVDQPMMAGAAAKPKFFGKGGAGWQILGSLGDAFMSMSGNPGLMAMAQNNMAMRRAGLERQQQLADEDRKHRQAQADWMQQQIWKQAHPDDDFTRYMTAAGIDPASPQAQALYRQRAESMAAPPLVAVDGFDASGNPTKTFMPRTGVGAGGGGQPASPPIGFVRNGFKFMGGDYRDRNSWQPVGGASPSGSQTFR